MRSGLLAVVAVVLLAPSVGAQSIWTYRARTTAETSTTERNGAGPPAGEAPTWQSQHRLVATADGTWSAGDRWRAGGGLAALATGNAIELRVREMYVRTAGASWLDVEAGKRILRWGVGYGFAPAGVLDPPRIATDPADRLQLNEGSWLARADLYRGDSSFTLGVADGRAAGRLSTLLGGGVELGLISAASSGEGPQYAATITHVIGQQLEWHAEALVHDHDGDRVVSAAAGIQYTFTAGLNVVLEYHRNGRGFDRSGWSDVLAGRRAPGPRPSRQNFMFVRLATAGGENRIAPEMIVMAGVDDWSWTLVPSVTWTPHPHLQAYVRATRLSGPPQSIAGLAPFATSLTGGIAARF